VATVPRFTNRLLQALKPADLALLKPGLEPIALHLRDDLEIPKKRIEHVYFPTTGIVSVVAVQPKGVAIEIGLVGREGMTGAAVVLGTGTSPHATYIQAAGTGERIAANELTKAMNASETLHKTMLAFVQVFMLQTAHTAVANAHAKLHERLARWLLMAHDRIPRSDLPLTHEFLSLMLGVRRAGVTEALHVLEDKRMIRCSRGTIAVLDRKAIEKVAGGFYGAPEAEYRRLVG
jgi:CRP-like cAMP-binding protein